jgi:aminocarboxymuconate-semialdehyde decarboxylase
MKVVDVHTHLLNDAYLARLKRHGGGYKVRKVLGGQTGIVKDGAPFMTLMPGMFDYELRIRAMDEAGVDIAIVTLTSPKGCLARVDALPATQRDAARGGNAMRIFKLQGA